ncbi:MAG: alanine racemase [Gammaproteobacteria bacterium]
MTRPVHALVDPVALQHNLRRVREAAGASRVMAVIKANGYGHGLLTVARALDQADAFALTSLEEALVLRDNGVEHRIALLEGFFDPDELDVISHQGLDIVVHQSEQIASLEKVRVPRPVAVWLKVDSGMHRLGFAPDEVASAAARLRACAAVGSMGFLSHLACADDRRSLRTHDQCETFDAAVTGLDGPRSLANSAGVLGWPATHLDWVRPGVMLYGVSPFLGGTGSQEGLRPAMTFSTQLVAINRHRRGDAVGYGASWTCPEDMPVGVATVGYGDGYPRHAGSGTPVLVNGRRASLAGRVSMDMITIDLRGHPHARVGDPVVLWGDELAVEEVAEHAGTIAYELLCAVSERVPRYPRHGAVVENPAMAASATPEM